MEGDHQHVLLPRRDDVAVDLGEHLDAVAVLVDPRGADEHRAHRLAVDAGDLEVRLERADLAPERVAPAGVVGEPEVLAVEHDHPRAGAQHGRAGADELTQRLGEPLALDPQRHRRRLAARDHEPVEPFEVGGHADLAHLGAEVAQHPRVRLEVALEREDADERRAHQPRLASSCCSSSLRDSSEAMACPRPSEARATRSASRKCVVASTIAAARVAGSSDLKMPEPTNRPSAPSCIISDASAGVAMPPAQNSTTGSLPSRATWRTRSSGAWCSLAAVASWASSITVSALISPVMRRMWRTASTMSPVPASPLERIMAAPSAIRRSASPRLVAPHTNGTLKFHLSMWLASSAGVRTSDSST